MSKKEYTFSVPVKGEEYTTVEAESLEEAIEKYKSGDFLCKPIIDDLDIDIGWNVNLDKYLRSAVTIGEVNDN